MIQKVFWIFACLLALNQLPYPGAYKNIEYRANFALFAFLILLFLLYILEEKSLIKKIPRMGAFIFSALFIILILIFLIAHGFQSARPMEWLSLIAITVYFFICFIMCRGANSYKKRFLYFLGYIISAEAIFTIFQFFLPNLLYAPFANHAYRKWAAFRMIGTFDHPNQLAGLLIVGVIIMCWIIVSTGKLKSRLFHTTLILANLVALFLTDSRGALFGLVVGLFIISTIYFWARRKKIRTVLFLLFLLIIGLQMGHLVLVVYEQHFEGFICNYMRQRLLNYLSGNRTFNIPDKNYADFNKDGLYNSTDLVLASYGYRIWWLKNKEKLVPTHRKNLLNFIKRRFECVLSYPDGPIRSRALAYLSDLHIWLDHKWGIGIGNYTKFIAEYGYTDSSDSLYRTHPHCLPIQFLVEMGVPGFLAWLIQVVILILFTYKYFRQTTGKGSWVTFFFIGFCVYAIIAHNLVDTTIYFDPMKFIFPPILAIFVSKFHPMNQYT